MDLTNTRFSALVPVFVALVLSLFIACPVFAANEPTPVAPSGGGTVGNPYLISSLGNLYWITQDSGRWDDQYKQTANITLTNCANWDSSQGWTPIGNNATTFTGSYDGQGYTISGLRINRATADNQGLFGHVGTGDGTETTIVIKNLGLTDVTVAASRGVGALIGRVTGNHYTRIGKCYASSGSVTGDGATGGLIGSHNSWKETPGGTENPILGYSWSDLSVAFSETTILTSDEPDKFGGLVGCSQKGTISDCYARGSVTVNATEGYPGQRVGGLAGCNIYRGEMYNSYSTGLVATTNCTYVGGLLGRKTEGGSGNDGIVTASFWDTETSGQAASEGGTGKTTAQMKTQNTFTDADWNFTDIWAISGAVNDGYPYIQDKPLLIELLTFNAQGIEHHVRLEWETASEIDHAGFHLWRSDAGDGTYSRITDTLIPAEGGATFGFAYAYVDIDLMDGQAYFYKLETIDNSGENEFFGPVSTASVLGDDREEATPVPTLSQWGAMVLFLILGAGAVLGLRLRRRRLN